MWVNLVVLIVSLFIFTSVRSVTLLSAAKESHHTLSKVEYQESTSTIPYAETVSDVDSDTAYENCLQALYQGCYNYVIACSGVTTTVDAWRWLLSATNYYYVDSDGYIRTNSAVSISSITYNAGGVLSCSDPVNYGRYLADGVRYACEGFKANFNGIKNQTYNGEKRGNLCALNSEALLRE